MSCDTIGRGGRRETSQAGFTLVELLVAIAVLAMLMGLLTTGVRMAVRSFEAVQREADELSALERAESTIVRYLSRARPVIAPFEDIREIRVDFSGDAESLTFRAFLPAALGGWEARLVLAVAEAEDGGRVLVLDVEGMEGVPEAERFALLDGIEEVEIGYLDPAEKRDGAEWSPDWHDRATLPDLVRIALRREDEPRPLPAIIVPLLIDGR